ncbi:MAG: hypothetical protein O8C64_11720, partial [Candidatus Methanoperedens sp.]|nr:hypothetical protein [Candidatus Methanoperedens sp.]
SSACSLMLTFPFFIASCIFTISIEFLSYKYHGSQSGTSQVPAMPASIGAAGRHIAISLIFPT